MYGKMVRILNIEDRKGIIDLAVRKGWFLRKNLRKDMAILGDRLICGQIIGEVVDEKIMSVLLWTMTDSLRLGKIVKNDDYIPPARTGEIPYINTLVRDSEKDKKGIFELTRFFFGLLPEAKEVYYFRRKYSNQLRVVKRRN